MVEPVADLNSSYLMSSWRVVSISTNTLRKYTVKLKGPANKTAYINIGTKNHLHYRDKSVAQSYKRLNDVTVSRKHDWKQKYGSFIRPQYFSEAYLTGVILYDYPKSSIDNSSHYLV